MNAPFYGQGAGNRAPSNVGFQKWVEAEFRKLWIKVRQPEAEDQIAPDEAKWSYSGTVNPTTETLGQPWLPPVNIVLLELVITLASSSGSAYQVRTYIGGVNTRTDSLSAGETSIIHQLRIPVEQNVAVAPRLLANAGGSGVGLGIAYRWVPA